MPVSTRAMSFVSLLTRWNMRNPLFHELVEVGVDEKLVEHEGLGLVIDDHVCDYDAGLPVTEVQFAEAQGVEQVCPGGSDEGDKIVVAQMSAVVDVLRPDLNGGLEFVDVALR